MYNIGYTIHFFTSPKDPLPQTTYYPLKAVPIAVADEEGSESEEDEIKPRGIVMNSQL